MVKLRDVVFTFQTPTHREDRAYVQFHVRAEDAGAGRLRYVISMNECDSVPEAIVDALREALSQVRKVKLPPIEAQQH